MAQQSGVALGLPTFGGATGSISRFISDFKTYTAFQGWDAAKQASLLPLCLTGIARDAYDSLPEASKKSISLAFEGLKQAFPSHSVVEAQVQLRGLKFDPESDLDAFAIRLKKLVTAAFPDSEVESLLFNYFMQALPMHFQSRLISDGITSFDTALATVRNMCCASRLNVGQPSGRDAPVRKVHTEADLLRRRVEELENKLAQFEGRRGGRVDGKTCFCCGGEGHYRRNCRSRNSVCYRCGIKGHLARVCSHSDSENQRGAVWSVPPRRPPFPQRGAVEAQNASITPWTRAPVIPPQSAGDPHPRWMAAPQARQAPREQQARAAGALSQQRASTA